MRRVLVILAAAFLIIVSAPMSKAEVIPSPPQWNGLVHRDCDETPSFCPDPFNRRNYEGEYVGHDEPALLFYSKKKGSGHSSFYTLRLPKEPPTKPNQKGSGGVYNFQIHHLFWFGMAMCDTQSAPAPNPQSRCEPDSDKNIFDSPDPTAKDYIGKHPGSAFLELQFYAPGWIDSPELVSDSTWFAALTISSYSVNMNTGQQNNGDCVSREFQPAGLEPQNFAVVTKNGVPLLPSNPLGISFGTFKFDLSNVLSMYGGDIVKVSIEDTPEGVKVELDDITTGQSGSMIAGIAEGFGQVNFQPNASSCSVTPYAFHPMYDTSTVHTRVPWTEHTYNIAFADELGHFEFCNKFNASLQCTVPGVDDPRLDADDFPCANPGFFGLPSSFIQITGCIGADLDFDGTPYRLSWPGTNWATDASLHPEPIRFRGAQFRGPGNSGFDDFDRVAFEANMPGIEPLSICALNGAGCVNPPPGAQFYPIFSTTTSANGQCLWQFGGLNIPGTTNNFGGTSTAEFGGLLTYFVPAVGGPSFLVNNFRQILNSNPCRVNDRRPNGSVNRTARSNMRTVMLGPR